ncbi:MAG: FG-GAP repeat protein [Chthoniobacteraceae bacterium]
MQTHRSPFTLTALLRHVMSTSPALVLGFVLPAIAPQPNTLIHSIPAPFGTPQSGAALGRSVAVEGGLTVAGAPLDDNGGLESGAVKVFDSGTGALLYVLPNHAGKL